MQMRPGTPIRVLLAVLVVLVPLAFGVQLAAATTPNNVQYCDKPGGCDQSEVKGVQQSAPKPLKPTQSSGTLPFTGADLALAGVVGAALVAGGFGLRAAGRKRTE